MRSPRLLTKNPLCTYPEPCPRHAKAVVASPVPWPDGKGAQQNVWCCRCSARGVISTNFEHGGKIKGIVVPDARVDRTGRLRTRG